MTIPAPQLMHLGERVTFRQGLLNNLFNPTAGVIFATIHQPGDPQLWLVLMMLAYDAILLGRLNLYGYVVSKAGQSRFGSRVRAILQGATGVLLSTLGVRLACEKNRVSFKYSSPSPKM